MDPSVINRYKVIRRIGIGTYSEVYEVQDIESGVRSAVRHISNSILKRTGIEPIEIEILTQIKHPNLVHAEEFYCDKSGLYIVEELASYDLCEIIKRKMTLPKEMIIHFFYQMIQGLIVLHQDGILHGDVKCSNFLYFVKSDQVRLNDFSLSSKLAINRSNGRIYTCTHRPPEVWIGKKWDFSADIWALGVSFYELLFAAYPYPYDSERQEDVSRNLKMIVRWASLTGQILPPRYIKYYDPYCPIDPSRYDFDGYLEFRDLIVSCLSINPSKRPKAIELFDHPLFNPIRKPLTPVNIRIDLTEDTKSTDDERLIWSKLREFNVDDEQILKIAVKIIKKCSLGMFDDISRITLILIHKLICGYIPPETKLLVGSNEETFFLYEFEILKKLSFKIPY